MELFYSHRRMNRFKDYSGIARCFLCFFALFCGDAAAQVTLDSAGRLTVETSSLRVKFDSGAVTSFFNKTTAEEYIVQAGPPWMIVSMMDSPGSGGLTAGAWRLAADPLGGAGARIAFSDGVRTAELQIGIDPASDEMIVRIVAHSNQAGVQSAQWGIFGFDLDKGKLIIPGQAGIVYDRDTQLEVVGLDYPTHWESQFVVYESQKGSLLGYARESTPAFKRLNASRLNGNLDFGFEIFAVAPWEAATTVPELELRWKAFASDWHQPAAYYKERWRAREATPPATAAWTKDIGAVVTILFLDAQVLDELASRLDATRTLLYLVPWRKAGFDRDYPNYSPSDDATSFIEKARELGFRIMLHANALGVSETNPNYPLVQDSQLRLPNTKERIGWLWDLPEGDERRVAYISPNSAVYRKLFIDSIRPAIERLRPDAIHLDAGGTIQNDGNGLVEGENTIQGISRFLAEVHEAFPGVALGYESLTEPVSPYIQFAQRWSSDYPSHALGTFLFGDRTRSFGFLDQPAPDENEFLSYLRRYEGQGILPTAPVSGREDFSSSRPRMLRLLQQMKLWQQHGFRPDWDSDWDEAVFRYRSSDGQTTAVVEDKDNQRRLLVNDRVIYQRTRNTTSRVVENRHIRDWPAYRAGALIGLDPTAEYWLEEELTPDAEQLHVTSVPESVHIAPDSFFDKDFAVLHVEVNAPPPFNFVGELRRAVKGTFYRGFGDFALVNGATVATSPVVVGERVRNSALIMHPPYQRIYGGVVFVEYTLTVPDAPAASLNLDVALADSTARTTPALFAVWVNGEEIWRDYYAVGDWHNQELNLTRWRGQTIRLRLIGGPSATGNPFNAVTCWSNVRVVASGQRPATPLRIYFPQEQPFGVSKGSVLEATADPSVLETMLNAPGRLAVFAVEPALPELGKDLVDIPFRSFRRTFDSLPSPYRDADNAVVRSGVSDGVEIPKALHIQPPTRGRIYTSWALRLADEVRTLSFNYGLLDPLPLFDRNSILYSGASFHVFVNGQEVFDAYRQVPGSNTGSVDLTPWAGTPVVIQVAVDADGTAIFDWGFFSELKLGN